MKIEESKKAMELLNKAKALKKESDEASSNATKLMQQEDGFFDQNAGYKTTAQTYQAWNKESEKYNAFVKAKSEFMDFMKEHQIVFDPIDIEI